MRGEEVIDRQASRIRPLPSNSKPGPARLTAGRLKQRNKLPIGAAFGWDRPTSASPCRAAGSSNQGTGLAFGSPVDDLTLTSFAVTQSTWPRFRFLPTSTEMTTRTGIGNFKVPGAGREGMVRCRSA
jgi:hypothetical protein